jgi:hypothetical protein
MPPGYFDAKQPAITPPPPLPAPNEAELRARLREAITAENQALADRDCAAAVHRRSVELVENRKAQLASFAGLDAEVTQATVAGLRSGDGRYDLPDALRAKQIAREQAKRDLEAAEAAKP